MRKLHDRLKASAPKRRQGTGRSNPQEGIIDGMVRKRQEAKTFEKIGRATHAAKNRPAVDMPMKGAKLNSHNATLGQVNQTERPQSIESMKAEGVAAQPAQPKYTGPRGPVRGNNAPGPGIVRPTGQGRSIHMNGPGGRVEARDAQFNRKMNERPRATGAVESSSGHIFDAMSLGTGALVGTGIALLGYGVRKGTEMAIKTGVRKKMVQQAASLFEKDAAKAATQQASQSVVRNTSQGVARTNPFAAHVSAPRPPTQFTPSGLPRPNARLQTSTNSVGQNTVTRPSSGAGNPFTQNPTRPAGSQTQIEKMADSVTKLKNTNKFNEAARRGGERVTGSSTAYPGLPLAKRLPQGSKSYPKPANVIGGKNNTWW